MFDLISIGDARVDIFLKVNEAHLVCLKNQQSCKLCLNYGDKIPVEQLKHLFAGNNNNNAIGASRLGLKTALYAEIGDDTNGQGIKDNLKKEGVDTRYIHLNKDKETELSTVINFKGERTILVYHQPWDYDLPDLDKTKWVYFSSVSYSFSKTNLIPQLVNFLERTGANLMYTPGTHQLIYGVKKFPKLLSNTSVFIVNLEEAKRVLGLDETKKEDIKKLLTKLSDLGPKKVVITNGGEGSDGFDGEKFYRLDVFPAKLIEMTGAGDAYATGLLAGLVSGKNLPEAMRWGAANGASVIEQIGPQAGLLTQNQMQEKLKVNSKIIAKEI